MHVLQDRILVIYEAFRREYLLSNLLKILTQQKRYIAFPNLMRYTKILTPDDRLLKT